MIKEKSLRIRLSEEDFKRLQDYANHKDVPMSQIIRDYIRRLPRPEKPS
jgi:predicted DNA binding CopG/RHH family protein